MAMRYEDDFEQQRRLLYAQRPEQYNWCEPTQVIQRFYVKQSEDPYRTWDVWERRVRGPEGQSNHQSNQANSVKLLSPTPEGAFR